VQHPAGADIRRRESSDLTGTSSCVAAFPGPLANSFDRVRVDASLPAGSMERSRKTGSVIFFIVRSGPRSSAMVTERRTSTRTTGRRSARPEDPRASLFPSIPTTRTHGRGLVAGSHSPVARRGRLRRYLSLHSSLPRHIRALRATSTVVIPRDGGARTAGDEPATRGWYPECSPNRGL